jgi:hypothetical protein
VKSVKSQRYRPRAHSTPEVTPAMCRALNGEIWGETLISVKTPPPSPETGYSGFGSVDASWEEIEGRHPRVSWVSHVHGPYSYLVIRTGRSNRSSLEGCGTPPRVNRLHSRARVSADPVGWARAASDGSPHICPPNSFSTHARTSSPCGVRLYLPAASLAPPQWRYVQFAS